MWYDVHMSYEVIIASKNLEVVSFSPGVERVCRLRVLRPGISLLEGFPFLGDLFENASEVSIDGMVARLATTNDMYVVIFTPEEDVGHPGSASGSGADSLWRDIVEDAPVGIILTDEDGRIEYLNRKQEQNSRRAREDLYNRDIRDVYRRTFRHPEVVRMYDALVSGKNPVPTTIVDHYNPQFYRRDMTIKFQGKRLARQGKIAIFVDIEEELYRQKRKAEKTGEELRLSRTYLTRLLDASPNMVVSVDGRRNILSFNRTAERLLGYKAEKVYGSCVDMFFPKEEIPKIHLAVDAAVPWFGTTHILHADGTSFPVELSSTKITDEEKGKYIATLLLMVDIRERNRLRRDLIQSQKMTFIGELVSGLAHQLNNPLVGVVNIADVLLKSMDGNDERTAYVRMIKEAGDSCREVVARLLSFSRRHDTLLSTRVDVVSVMNAAVDLLARHPRYKDVRVDRAFDQVPPVTGDPVLLQQAFINILTNAAQAMDGKGTIKVGISVKPGTRPQVLVAVEDHGRGIEEKDLTRVFEPFFSTKDTEEGTGIGLSLAYWIVKDHGGRIAVDSAVGKGSTFTVILPAGS